MFTISKRTKKVLMLKTLEKSMVLKYINELLISLLIKLVYNSTLTKNVGH
jgi:hypothetical protein